MSSGRHYRKLIVGREDAVQMFLWLALAIPTEVQRQGLKLRLALTPRVASSPCIAEKLIRCHLLKCRRMTSLLVAGGDWYIAADTEQQLHIHH